MEVKVGVGVEVEVKAHAHAHTTNAGLQSAGKVQWEAADLISRPHIVHYMKLSISDQA